MENKKPTNPLLDKALNSFEKSTNISFFLMLNDNNARKEYYENESNKDFSNYIKESEEIYEEIEILRS